MNSRLMWRPNEARRASSNMVQFAAAHAPEGTYDYDTLYTWSVTHLDDFWAAIWVSYAEQALSQNAKTIDVVFAVLGLLALILRLAANIKSRGVTADRKLT